MKQAYVYTISPGKAFLRIEVGEVESARIVEAGSGADDAW